jgi:hypothetical protein
MMIISDLVKSPSRSPIPPYLTFPTPLVQVTIKEKKVFSDTLRASKVAGYHSFPTDRFKTVPQDRCIKLVQGACGHTS